MVITATTAAKYLNYTVNFLIYNIMFYRINVRIKYTFFDKIKTKLILNNLKHWIGTKLQKILTIST